MQGLDGAHRASVLAHVHEGKLFHDCAAHDRTVGREEGCQLLRRRIRPVDIAHKDLHLDAAAAFPERRERSYSDRQNVRTTRSPPQEWLATENPAAQAPKPSQLETASLAYSSQSKRLREDAL